MLLTFIILNPEGQKHLGNDLKPRDSMAACFLTQSMQMKTQSQAPLHKPWEYKSVIVLTNLFSPRSQPQIWGCGCCCAGNPLNLHFHPEPQQSWSFSHTCVGPSQDPDAACSSPDPAAEWRAHRCVYELPLQLEKLQEELLQVGFILITHEPTALWPCSRLSHLPGWKSYQVLTHIAD